MALLPKPSYLLLPNIFYHQQQPEKVAQPKLLLWNAPLAAQLGFAELTVEQRAAIFSGNALPDDAFPLAQAYAGHQFGHFTMLGDGRAILIGEVLTQENRLLDVQLKGAGQTPYSRRGDGRATKASMLREFLISEAMFALGIPTSRSLAVVVTDDPVYRERIHTGAILTRIAGSHIRVGTFEYARNFGSEADLSALLSYSIKRHYPDLAETENPALHFLQEVRDRQIDLIVNWMRVGFIHGVMNTDNMGVSAETFDYGPCAFMNAYHPDTVFSSIDTQGRYAFGNQPLMARWNIAALASALLPLLGETETIATANARAVIDGFMPLYQERYSQMMNQKLGWVGAAETDKHLISSLFDWMEKAKADFTNTFLVLSGDLPEEGIWLQKAFQDWKRQWLHRCGPNGPDFEGMRRNNPMAIPRNHLVEEVLSAAQQGAMQPFQELFTVLQAPYKRHSISTKYLTVPEEFDAQYQTFCGT